MKLSIVENKRFNKLFCGLLNYVSQVYDIEPWLDFSHSIPEETEALCRVKDYLWENDNLINEYIQKNPNNLNINDCETVSRWKYHNTNNFFYLGENEGLSIFADDFHFYGVTSHSREINEMLNAGGSIIPVETTLLPYDGRIVYDTTIANYPVYLGPNMTEKIDDDFEIAVSEDRIILNSKDFIEAMKIPKNEKESRSMIYEEAEYDVIDEKNIEFSEEEIIKVAEEIKNDMINMFTKSIISGEPVTELSAILKKKTKTQLMDLCKKLKISGISSYNKGTLIEILGQELYRKDFLEQFFLFISDENMEFLDKIVDKGIMEVEFKQLTELSFSNPLYRIIVFSFDFEGKYYVVVSDEFKSVYNEITASDYRKKREVITGIHNLANAMVKLYGVISIDDYIEEYERFFGRRIEPDEVTDNLETYMIQSAGLYDVVDNDIVHFEIAEDFEWYEDVKASIENKPRKVFSTDIIEKNFDEDYYENSKELSLIEEFIIENAPDFIEPKYRYDSFMSELYDLFVMDIQITDILKHFEEYDLIFDMDQTNALLSLIANANNNTALWGNNGWTPTELSGRSSTSDFTGSIGQIPVKKDDKPGRNDPCPCGSGKKYKKCCMLKDN